MSDKHVNTTTARCPDCDRDIVITGTSTDLPDNCECGKVINYAKISVVMLMRIVDYLENIDAIARTMAEVRETK